MARILVEARGHPAACLLYDPSRLVLPRRLTLVGRVREGGVS